MKKIIAILTALSLIAVLAGCVKTEEAKVTPAKLTFSEQQEEFKNDAGEVYAELRYVVPSADEAHGALNDALQNSFSSELYEDIRSSFREMADWTNETGELLYERSTTVDVRCDEAVVSLLSSGESYTGGAHGYAWSAGKTFDPQTGEELSLSDVLKAPELLPAILSEKLLASYDAESFFDSPELLLAEYEIDAYSWVLTEDGIDFYFNPYEIGPYASGIFAVSVGYEEQPDLFIDRYIK